ncbi:MAG TPA: hypothetical protein VJ201_06285 [Candidatus Babeliales bacterium]|nr:hypothetical protein [Candidatus Babeliales bacterium]
MIKIIEHINNIVSDMDERKFYLSFAGVFVVLLVPILFLIFFTRSSMYSWQARIDEINQKRTTIAAALTRFSRVRKERERVNAKLNKEKTFKIAGYFQEVTESLNISRNLAEEPRTTTARLDKDYTEIILTARLNDLSMQRLVDLLSKISAQELVYTKKLDITKHKGSPPAIDVSITIATLAQTSEVA